MFTKDGLVWTTASRCVAYEEWDRLCMILNLTLHLLLYVYTSDTDNLLKLAMKQAPFGACLPASDTWLCREEFGFLIKAGTRSMISRRYTELLRASEGLVAGGSLWAGSKQYCRLEVIAISLGPSRQESGPLPQFSLDVQSISEIQRQQSRDIENPAKLRSLPLQALGPFGFQKLRTRLTWAGPWALHACPLHARPA